jgi:hypothetical protein
MMSSPMDLGPVSNPMDMMQVLRDLIRREEAEHLHQAILDLRTEWSKEPAEQFESGQTRKEALLCGLDEAMLIIDARIGHLRDRWG